MRRLKALRQGQNSPAAQTADPAAITPSPAAQVVITPPPQQPGPMPPSSGVPLSIYPHKASTASTTASKPGSMPPSSGVPLSIPPQNLNSIHNSIHPRIDTTFLWRPPLHPNKKRHPADPTLPDTGTKTPVKQTYTMYNQHSLSAQLNYHQKVLSATQDRWPAL